MGRSGTGQEINMHEVCRCGCTGGCAVFAGDVAYLSVVDEGVHRDLGHSGYFSEAMV